MKRFIIHIVFFSLPLVLAFFAAEYLLQKIPNMYSSKYENFVKSEHQIKILVLGSSHAHYGINPNHLSKPSYNLANVSQGLFVDQKLLEREMRSMDSLETIIIPISYFTLWFDDNQGEIEWRKYYYLRFYHLTLPVPYEHIAKKYSLISLFGLKPSIEAIRNHFFSPQKIRTCDKYGWGYGYPIGNDIDFTSDGRAAAIGHESNDRLSYDKNLDRLKQICSLAKFYHKKIIFVSLPTRPEYRINLNQQKVAGDKKVIRELQDRYSNVTYLDYENDDRFDKSDFYNTDHLNSAGASKFTKILDGACSRAMEQETRH